MKTFFSFFLAISMMVVSTSAQGVTKQSLPDMPFPRMNSQTVATSNGLYLAIGGHSSGFTRMNTVTSVAHNDSAWANFTLTDFRDATGIVHLSDSTCLLIGGMSSDLGVGQLSTTERVYPNLLQSAAGPALLNARTMANGVQLANGKVLVAGCWYSDVAAAVGEVIDLATNQVTLTGNLNQPRAYPTFVPTSDGGAIMFGGWGVYGGLFSGAVEEYNPATNTFTKIRDNLFADDPDYRVVTDFGEDMQHKKLSNGKYVFLARKFQNGEGWRVFTVDPVTKQFEVIVPSLPISQTGTGFTYLYLSPIIDTRVNDLVMIPQIWTDPQGKNHVSIPFFFHQFTSTIVFPVSDVILDHWPYYSSRSLYITEQQQYSGIIFMGGNLTSNFDAVPNAFIAQLWTHAGVDDGSGAIEGFTLEQNYPNPFNPSTVIKFSLPNQGNAKLTLYDVTGKEIAVIADGMFESGNHSVNFDATGLTSGVYFYTLSSNGNSITKKMTVIK